MAENGKYYWLKLKRDFFKRHDIQIIESMPNGKDYILFYLKLLCESVDHDGNLRFSEEIPYNDQMLATITNTNIDIVRNAVKLFIDLRMMDIMDDGTFYMTQVEKMIGSETKWAKKKRLQRAKGDNVPLLSPNCPTEIEKDKEIKIDTENKSIEVYTDSDSPNLSPAPKAKKPSKSKYGEYSHVRLTKEEYEKLETEYGKELTAKSITFLDEYIEMKGYKAKSHYLAIRKWVIDAVKEREFKDMRNGKQSQSQGSFDTDDFFNAAVAKSERLTAADSEEIRAKAERLKEMIK